MSSQSGMGREEAYYRNRRILAVVGVLAALALACCLGALLGGTFVFGLNRVGDGAYEVESRVVDPRVLPGGPTIEKERGLHIMSTGAIIVDVMADSPAEEAGLRAGDVIVAVGGQQVDEDHDLRDLIAEYAPGDRVTLEVERPGEGTQRAKVRLGEHPEDEDVAFLGVQYASSIIEHEGERMLPFGDLDEFDPDEWPALPPSGGRVAGVVIVEVVENSPADEGGLQSGDVVIAVDGEQVESPQTLVDMVGAYDPGDEIVLRFFRPIEGQEMEIDVTLGEHPEDRRRAYLGVLLGGMFQQRRFDWQGDPQQFRFYMEPGEGWEGMPFDLEELPFNWDELPFDPEDLPFEPGQLPFNPDHFEFDWDYVPQPFERSSQDA